METIIQYILSPVIVGLVSYIVYLLKNSKKKEDANARGIMLLLRRQIVDDYEKFATKGEPMTAFDYENIDEVYSAYKTLEGNGMADKMFKELQGIDIVKEETK